MPGPRRLDKPEHGAGLREEAARRVLRVEPGLDGVPVEADVALVDRQPLAGRDPDLLLDEVEPGDQLGDRVLDLEPGVHLQEEEVARPVGVDDELDGAGAGVADGLGGIDGRAAHRRPRGGVQQRRRRLLDHLLVPALQAALALTEVDHVAVGVAEDLHLDVPGVADVPLDQQGVVAERAARLAPGRRDRLGQLGLRPHHAHALATAAGAGLEQHREPDGDRGVGDLRVGHPRLCAAGDDGHAGGHDRLLGADLVGHRLDRGDGRADEDDAGLLAGAREIHVLGEEPVAGVNRLGAGAGRCLEHPLDRQIALRRRGRPDGDGDVGQPGVQGAGIRVAVHRHRPDAHRAQRADHADGDLAPVGHEHCLEHLRHRPVPPGTFCT
jgi:hypothetical protein